MFEQPLSQSRASAIVPPDACSPAAVVAELASIERAQARVVEMLCELEPDAIAREHAMPAEMALSLVTRIPRWQIRRLLSMAASLRTAPVTRGLLARGVISFPQAEAICARLRPLSPGARAEAEKAVAALAERCERAEPEALPDALDAHLPADPKAEARAEEATARATFLAVQPFLDGSGSTIYGLLDAPGTAGVCAALDARARAIAAGSAEGHEQPHQGEHEQHERVGAHARAEALVAICEESLAGAGSSAAANGGTRARARLLLTLDVKDMAAPSEAGASVAWSALGRGRLSPAATAQAACDAAIQLVVFDGAEPLAVGDARGAIPGKIRTAVLARDGGCRFPGCSAPPAWSDIHHIRAGAGHDPANLVMLCRRCHTRVHRRAWRIAPGPDGTIVFRHRGRDHASAPRARPLRA